MRVIRYTERGETNRTLYPFYIKESHLCTERQQKVWEPNEEFFTGKSLLCLIVLQVKDMETHILVSL